MNECVHGGDADLCPPCQHGNTPPPYPERSDRSGAARCRLCDAPMWFGRTRNGKAMPIDVDPTPDGNVELVDGTVHVLAGAALAGARTEGRPLYTSHFVTCPLAERFRKG